MAVGQKGRPPGTKKTGGRRAGTPNKSSIAQGLSLSALAQQHTPAALATLVHVAANGVSEAARVSAAIALLDRGYGRPTQALDHKGGGITIVLDELDMKA
jgi:hypothetical protein